MGCNNCKNHEMRIKADSNGIYADPYGCVNFEKKQHPLDEMIESIAFKTMTSAIGRKILSEKLEKLRYESINYGVRRGCLEKATNTDAVLRRDGKENWIPEEKK